MVDGKFEEVEGTEREIPADLVLLAMGFTGPERGPLLEGLGVELDGRGNVARSADWETTEPGVFVCGDAGRGQSLIVWAIAEGRACAAAVDRRLAGHTLLPSPILTHDPLSSGWSRSVTLLVHPRGSLPTTPSAADPKHRTQPRPSDPPAVRRRHPSCEGGGRKASVMTEVAVDLDPALVEGLDRWHLMGAEVHVLRARAESLRGPRRGERALVLALRAERSGVGAAVARWASKPARPSCATWKRTRRPSRPSSAGVTPSCSPSG